MNTFEFDYHWTSVALITIRYSVQSYTDENEMTEMAKKRQEDCFLRPVQEKQKVYCVKSTHSLRHWCSFFRTKIEYIEKGWHFVMLYISGAFKIKSRTRFPVSWSCQVTHFMSWFSSSFSSLPVEKRQRILVTKRFAWVRYSSHFSLGIYISRRS